MDESTWDLPDNPILMPGPMTVGSLTRVDNSEANAVGEVLRAERIALWKRLWQGRRAAEKRAVLAESEVARLQAEVAELEARLARRN